jgi:hypothetical protein
MIILHTAGDTIQATASAASAITITLYGMERTDAGTNYKKLGQGTITNSGTTTLYTLPADTTAVVSQLIAVNVDTSKRTFDLWHVPNGGSAGNTNILLDDMELSSKQTWIWGKEG